MRSLMGSHEGAMLLQKMTGHNYKNSLEQFHAELLAKLQSPDTRTQERAHQLLTLVPALPELPEHDENPVVTDTVKGPSGLVQALRADILHEKGTPYFSENEIIRKVTELFVTDREFEKEFRHLADTLAREKDDKSIDDDDVPPSHDIEIAFLRKWFGGYSVENGVKIEKALESGIWGNLSRRYPLMKMQDILSVYRHVEELVRNDSGFRKAVEDARALQKRKEGNDLDFMLDFNDPETKVLVLRIVEMTGLNHARIVYQAFVNSGAAVRRPDIDQRLAKNVVGFEKEIASIIIFMLHEGRL